MALNVGSRLGHYDVTALIGEGGMGQVYRDTEFNHQAAPRSSLQTLAVSGPMTAIHTRTKGGSREIPS